MKKWIKTDIDWFAGELNKDEVVLTNAQYNQVTNPVSMLEPEQKAAEMMKHLLGRVELDPDYLEEFVKVLKKKEKKFKPLLKKLDQGGGGSGGGGGGAGGGTQDAISQVG